MLEPNPLPESPEQPLPLFRAEALAAQQQKFYGEILLIRPLTLGLLIWLGIGISAVVLGFLLLGSYTQRARVAGVLLPGDGTGVHADLYVPEQAIQFVQPGQSLRLRCQSCSGQEFQTQTGTVSEISTSALSPKEVAAQSKMSVQAPMYRITLTLSPDGTAPLPQGARVEADLPLGKRPLLQWLFERGDSTLKSARAENAAAKEHQ
jgi:membrane fusion protein